MKSTSLRLEQLYPRVEYTSLQSDATTDTVVIGGGIAGCITAWCLLRETSQQIMLLDGGKIARGATWHNAWQATTYFEKKIASLVEKYGLEKTLIAQRDMFHSLSHLEECVARMSNMHNIHVSLVMTQELCWLRTTDEVMNALEMVALFQANHIDIECLILDAHRVQAHPIDARFSECYSIVDTQRIQTLLQTTDEGFVGVEVRPVGLVNSALLFESLVLCMLLSYPDRFTVFEHTLVDAIHILPQWVSVMVHDGYAVQATDVVVCTNGFQQLPIIHADSRDMTPAIQWVIGYMNGYHIAHQIPSHAYTYSEATSHTTNFWAPPYWYVTSRPHPDNGSLICVGGEETHIDSLLQYNPNMECPATVVAHTNDFLKKTFIPTKGQTPLEHYQWHWLLWYTTSGIRMIWAHPHHAHIRYNLGCNGIGILPSIHGAYTIASRMSGATPVPSIFDVEL